MCKSETKRSSLIYPQLQPSQAPICLPGKHRICLITTCSSSRHGPLILTHHSLLTPFPADTMLSPPCLFSVSSVGLFRLNNPNSLALPTHLQPYLPVPPFLPFSQPSHESQYHYATWAPLLDILTSLGDFLCWCLPYVLLYDEFFLVASM